ncbi:hypothetical protein [Aurantimonas sp. VKM B-3413]|uniref:hypothetical protein n=1 Tax=Aurantimonas sp. VKM B-3413 TaxID=2779401 RepID=UPI001E37EB1B|nr:hypothetical protein [Aurantimonas sp. VKM B-3413]MCB8840236.1 hypothetical protein [Aurantimonas sp. VKM B-3413]
MPARARFRVPIGTFSDRTVDTTDHEMRTILLLAFEELPPALKARIAGKRPRHDWSDYDAARRAIAEHLVVRIRRSIDCEYRGSGARGGHG